MTLLALVAAGCRASPQPFPQALLVVDTDLPVPTLASHLRVDVFDAQGVWRSSRDFPLRSAEDYPASLSVYTPDEAATTSVMVRLRLRPDGAERDYRGERYVPFPAEDEAADRVDTAEPTSQDPRLVQNGVDVTPLSEPLPAITVDRLVVFRLSPGDGRRIRVTLRGDCIGRMADITTRTTCIDADRTSEQADEGDGPDNGQPTQVGSRLRDAARDVTNVPPSAVAIRGGAFVLGSFALSPESTTSQHTSSAPPRAAIVHGFTIDRTEVSVARYRAAVAAGFVAPSPVTVNPNPLATTSADPGASCTYRSTPDPNDPAREDLPITCVPFDTARAFCVFGGGDLPTEAQWEYAATMSGRERKTTFPSGEAEPTCAGVVFGRFDQKSYGDTTCHDQGFTFGPRGADAATLDVTPDGVRGLAGTVYEWIRGAPVPYDSACYRRAALDDPTCDLETGTHAVRGGDFGSPPSVLASALRFTLPAGGSTPRGGFRCVYPG